ncbi:type VI secretion system tip protein TssI/VgrG [Sorangium sp. So ce726]|uniref:type VI secretion system Vgr family protein n=1 Tax=Sorangium sp. So ce726 TaxID=3133319 RepID=UPI003F6073E7
MEEIHTMTMVLESEGQTWDHVRIHRLSGREAISELFSFHLDVVCDPGQDLPAEAVPGADITLIIEVGGVEIRRIHGVLGPLQDHLDVLDEVASYGLRIVPHASQMTLVETQEIYLDKSIPDIIRAKLGRYEPLPFEFRLMGTYPAREFVAQYQETDLAFVSRLAEHVGISFFFEHGDGHDKIVFTDHLPGFPLADELPFRPKGGKRDLFALERTTGVAPSNYIVQDYNYRMPLVELSACVAIEDGNGGGVVEYGNHVKTPEEAELIARVRSEERACRLKVYEGKSGVPTLCAGTKPTVVDHPKLPEPLTLLLVEVEHEATLPHFSGDEPAGGASYLNTLRAVPVSVPFRPARRTPRPRIAGVMTGLIQPGPQGETGGIAHIDSDGRYLVQLHFDTAPPGEQRASHRMRMAQPFAGPNYGIHMPLRRGTEVLIAFTNGDPDRPVIVGALYNAISPNPVVTANATHHQIKSSSGVLFQIGAKS